MTFKVKDGVVVGSTTALDANGKLATGFSTARTIALSGDVTGSATFDGTANATIVATIAADSVALGTDTTGNYVASLVAGTGISVGAAGEGATPTITNTAPNVTTDISITHNASTVVVNSSDGTDGTINAASTTTAGVMSSTDKTKLDGIASNANNYVLPVATSTVAGGVELFSDTIQSIAANAVSATASRTYGIQLNSAGQAVVNVPWTDTNSGGTVTSVSGTGTVSGLTLSGTVTSSGSLTLGGTLSLTSSQVTTALGYTPYNSTNPDGYITSSALSSYLPLTGGTITGLITFNTAAVDGGGATGIKANANGWSRIDPNGSRFLIPVNAAEATTSIREVIDLERTDTWAHLMSIYSDGSAQFSNLRIGGNSTPGSGNQVLHAGNYTSYSPSLTGSGASGTWGISITGNAATATSASNSDTTDGYHASTSATANTIAVRDASGYTFFNYINSNTANNENPSTVSQIIVTNGSDNYYRKASVAHLISNLGLAQQVANGVILENNQTITSNYTMTSGKNGSSAGPITINTGVTVTIPTGSSWVIV